MRVIDTQPTLDGDVRSLCRVDPALAAVVAAGARPLLRRRPAGFAGLTTIVIGQQVSTASAAAIARRLLAALPGLDPAALRAADDPLLRAVGLSGAKMRTLRALADAVLSGALPLDALPGMTAAEADLHLCAVPGIGPWTAAVYRLFCLGDADAFPAGDLALQEAARLTLALSARPDARALSAVAERWRPWRGAAAGILWAHYRLLKRRTGAPA